MKWQGRRQSTNIEDRRRSGSSGRAGAATSIGGMGVIIVVFIGYLLGVDVTPLLEEGASVGTTSGGTTELSQADEEVASMVAVVLADTEEVWTEIFRDQLNQRYTPPVLVLFSGATQSACGGASAATGPFYCPPEQKVYLDTDFFVTLERQLGAGGDFAAAYVVAHEVAHHVQNELGILDQANQQRARVSETQSNAISVRIELQADCLAGVWANVAQQRFDILQKGDIAEAMNAAERIGDDTLQANAGQRVRPDSFTHGTSEQRQRWFMRGFQTGDVTQCDTITARTL
jgi:predicted metalloprotease